MELLEYPHKALNTKCIYTPLTEEEVKDILPKLIQVGKQHKGLGIAANQVGWMNRVFIMYQKEAPIVIINPIILKVSQQVEVEEGCLSLPLQHFKLKRFNRVLLKFLDRNNKIQVKEFINSYAHCIQHEIDHLNGITLNIKEN